MRSERAAMTAPECRIDTLILGAGPLGLFEAAALAACGRRVLVAERGDRLGGAWTTLDLPGTGTVECGTHYLVDLPHVYGFLERVLEIDLAPLDPPAQYLLPRPVLSRRCVDFTRRWGGSISPRRYRGEISIRGFRNLVSPYYRRIRGVLGLEGAPRHPLKYIRGGTPALIDALERFVASRQIEVRFMSQVDELAIDTGKREVRARVGGEAITANEVVIPGSADLPEIRIDGRRMQVPGEVVPNVQLHVLVDDAPSRHFTFVQFSGSDHAVLASDLTAFCRPAIATPGRRLLSAYVRAEVPHDDATANAILGELKWAGLLEPDARPAETHWSRFDLPQRSLAELAETERMGGGLVRTLFTHSFSLAMSENAPRWEAALAHAEPAPEAAGLSLEKAAGYGTA